MSLKIAIVGAGGVGGYLAAKLTQNNHDVTLVARDENLEFIKENGLKVIEYKKDDFTVYPYTVDFLDSDIYDIIFIATKSCDYKSACKSIENAIDKNTLIIPLSDGIGVTTSLKSYLPPCVIGDGLIHIISELQSTGIVQRKSFTFYLQIACSVENINLKILEQLLNHCELRTMTTKSLRYERWKKYLFTSTMSMLTTYFDKPIGYIFKEQLELMVDILLEIQKVANAKNVDITNKDIEKVVNQASHVEYETKTAMQVEFENKSKSEFDLLIGYVVREANTFNISVPQMEKIYNVLKEKVFS
ncbi:2-dehydropantoate 2-reductase [Arcobacteraceae bacterium]|nr:2-dehydropantoate 2-reductase [Arcobacteraceae bacterium]